uniref:Deoxynucleoside triphosphate triphosphohydrolase SAMHD1-like n=1 Tax=Haplochromis burtoni TaxID=8153 RepID=A0A3Q2WZB0_HAPBU
MLLNLWNLHNSHHQTTELFLHISQHLANPPPFSVYTVSEKKTKKNQKNIVYQNFSFFFTQVFNDPIHGHIELDSLLVKIIDTPEFQRLRNIKQLGGSYYVFPGASHNRFEHSIGVAYLAGELATALMVKQPDLNINDRDVLCVQIAGLCHDLGHGPFSRLFDRMFNPEADPATKDWKDASIAMFNHLLENEDNKVKEEEDYELLLPEDLIFIKEMIKPIKSDDTKVLWPYKGRDENKSFLYEIVSNNQNGIDVDKFDCLARDCHHLGIRNNFDHHRFIMFARVCDVNGRKHICSRDKEVSNLHDMFHTWVSLHKKAYQHRVTQSVEMMIKDALLEANKRINIVGSGGNTFHLSTAKTDMKAYTKLTDQVVEEISKSTNADLEKAKGILKRITTRDLYWFVGQAKPVSKVVNLDYGMKDKDLINKIYFYNKKNLKKAFPILESETALAFLRVYLKEPKTKTAKDKAKKCFREWCKENDFEVLLYFYLIALIDINFSVRTNLLYCNIIAIKKVTYKTLPAEIVA